MQAKAGVPIRITKLVSYHTSRGVPARELVDRCRRTLDRVEVEGIEQQYERQRAVARWILAALGRAHQGSRRPAAGDALVPLPARPGRGARGRTGRPREGRDGIRVQRPLLLGHRDLRPPVPRLHDAALGSQRNPDALPDAARRPPARPPAERARCAVPLAHDQRRRGVGLLRRRNGAVPHQRRHLLCSREVRPGDRRHRLPLSRRDRHRCRDRPALGDARFLAHARDRWRGVVPHPRRDRPG